MTTAERHAVRAALRTADFSHSPGLRNRMRYSLVTKLDFEVVLLGGLAIWALLIWWLL